MENACHFPYAVAIPNHQATTLVKEIIKYFSIFGICEQILHDLGTDFTSELFSVMLQSFGVSQLRSTVCHPQTNIVEGYHRVMKKMLRAYVDTHKESWDKGLDLVMFAYREVPISDYGFSPFELLFGRHVVGPLSLLFDCWWSEPKADVSKHVLAHMLEIRDNMQTAADVVHASQEARQEKNKARYDKNCRPLKLKPDDLVLTFQTVPGDPLRVKYTGPHRIIKQTSDVDYLVEFLGTRKEQRNMHVNLLRKYFQRTEFVGVLQKDAVTDCQSSSTNDLIIPEVMLDAQEMDDADIRSILSTNVVTDLHAKLNHLSDLQQRDILSIVNDFVNLFSDKPGLANIDEHVIRLKPEAKVIRSQPYRMSPDSQTKLRVEINSLLAEGLIENTVSEWSSPAIVVPKPDKTVRAVIDFRRANLQFQGDSYPLPRIDDLIQKVGQSKVLSKFDLTKGFYQIPLAKKI
jgi:hypothetical protein